MDGKLIPDHPISDLRSMASSSPFLGGQLHLRRPDGLMGVRVWFDVCFRGREVVHQAEAVIVDLSP